MLLTGAPKGTLKPLLDTTVACCSNSSTSQILFSNLNLLICEVYMKLTLLLAGDLKGTFNPLLVAQKRKYTNFVVEFWNN